MECMVIIKGINEWIPKNARYILEDMILTKENWNFLSKVPANTAGARAMKQDNESPNEGTWSFANARKEIVVPCECAISAIYN